MKLIFSDFHLSESKSSIPNISFVFLRWKVPARPLGEPAKLFKFICVFTFGDYNFPFYDFVGVSRLYLNEAVKEVVKAFFCS